MKPIQFLFALIGSVTFGAILAVSGSAQKISDPTPRETIEVDRVNVITVQTMTVRAYPTLTANPTTYPSPYSTTFSPTSPSPDSSLLPSPNL